VEEKKPIEEAKKELKPKNWDRGVANKLGAIQQELKAPKEKKAERSAKGYGGYSYRSAEDILEALKPLLAKHKTMLWFNDKIEHIGDRYYVRSTVVLHDLELGEQHVATSYAREANTLASMSDGQITGATISYARKYALGAMFAIDNNKDLDDVASEEYKKDKPNEPNKIGRKDIQTQKSNSEEW
jgi:muconolactone delta-isomerase